MHSGQRLAAKQMVIPGSSSNGRPHTSYPNSAKLMLNVDCIFMYICSSKGVKQVCFKKSVKDIIYTCVYIVKILYVDT